MIIKIGSKISANDFREGIVEDIKIATSKNDVAGELGVEVKEYDTELGYVGSVKLMRVNCTGATFIRLVR